MKPETRVPIGFGEVLSAYKRSLLDDENAVPFFEEEFSRYVGVRRAKCVSRGRIALYLTIKALNIKQGEEVILPAYTSPIVPEVLMRCGVKPVFAQVDTNSLNILPQGIGQVISARTRAIVAVHMFGNPCRIDEIREIAAQNNLFLIEDAAQALGAEYLNRKVGSFGDVGIFSFGLGKNMTTVEGGMITSQNNGFMDRIESIMKCVRASHFLNFRMALELFLYPALTSPIPYEIISRLRRPVRETHRFDKHEALIEYNGLQATFGRMQLKKVDAMNERRMMNAKRIIEGIRHIRWLLPQKVEGGARPVFTRLILKHNRGKDRRDLLIHHLRRSSFDIPKLGDYFLARYADYPQDTAETALFREIKKEIVEKILVLPTSPSLEEQDLKMIVHVLVSNG